MEQDNEVEYAQYLFLEGYILGPGKCSCLNKTFTIQYDSSYKTSKDRLDVPTNHAKGDTKLEQILFLKNIVNVN